MTDEHGWRSIAVDNSSAVAETYITIRLEEYQALRARIAELEAAQAWRPIESAPVARKVLVAYKNSLGNWRRVLATNYPPDALDSEESESGYADPGWYEESETHEELFPLEYKPVAWMPLPKGPEES